MAPIPTSVEAVWEPGEGRTGSCRDGAAKAWGNAGSVRDAEKALRPPLKRCPWCIQHHRVLRGAARGAERPGVFGALSVVLKLGAAEAGARL